MMDCNSCRAHFHGGFVTSELNPPDMTGCGGCVVKIMNGPLLAASILSKKTLECSTSCVSMFDTDMTHSYSRGF